MLGWPLRTGRQRTDKDRGPGATGRLGEGPSRPTAAPGARLLQSWLRGSAMASPAPPCLTAAGPPGLSQPQLRSRCRGCVSVCVRACPVGCLEGDPSSLPSLSINVDQLCAWPEGHPQASDPSAVQMGTRGEKGNSGSSDVAPGTTGPGLRHLLCSQGGSHDPDPLPCPRPAPTNAQLDPFPRLSACSVLRDSELSEAQVAMVTRLSSPQDLLISDSAHSGVGSGDPRCPCHAGGRGGGHVDTRFPCRLSPHRPK